jgi:exosortase H (IPTLxxWG-CTERM-specific)
MKRRAIPAYAFAMGRDALAPSYNRRMTKFMVIFVVLVLALFAAELSAPAQKYFVLPWTDALTRAAAFVLQSFDGSVISQGKLLASTKSSFGVTVEAGCNGIEALIILVAAMLAFPAPWKHRVIGILIGAVTVQSLNLVRVITLFYIGQWSMQVFEWMHLYAWQALIMLDVLLVWVLWIRMLPAKPEAPIAPSAPASA